MFDEDIRRQFLLAGFTASTADPWICTKHDPVDPRHKCVVSMTVDDGLCMYTKKSIYTDLIAVLEARYGPLTHHAECTDHIGMQLLRQPNGGVTFTQSKYIERIAATFGVAHMSPLMVPSKPNLFHASKNTTPAPKAFYQQLLGSLVHALKTRHDIRKEVSHLSTKLPIPDESDLEKCINCLRYLASTPDEGPTFFTTDGPIIKCKVDSSFCVHEDGRSHTGISFHVGSSNAAFCAKSRTQKMGVAIHPTDSEYFSLSEASKLVVYFRQFAADLGFKQYGPTVIYQDNKTAIALAEAPQITRRSKHIFARFHNTRDLLQRKIIALRHLSTHEMSADLLTKPLGRAKFFKHRGSLFNSGARTLRAGE